MGKDRSGTGRSLRPLVAGLVCVLAFAAAPAARAGTLDQSQTAGSNASLTFAGDRWAAQTFTAGITGQLDQVDLFLRRLGNPGDLTVQIRDTSGGAPGPSVLASETIPQASIPDGTFTWTSVAFDPTAPSAAGTQYAIVLFAGTGSGELDPFNSYGWGANANVLGGDLYLGGELQASLDGGASWLGQAADAAFKTYVTTTTTIADLIESVEGLDLASGTENSLLKKLTGAQKNLDADDTAGACDKLASFIAEVQAQSGKKIDAEDAEDLIADAEAVRDSLGCG
jgi:hypothetical protein